MLILQRKMSRGLNRAQGAWEPGERSPHSCLQLGTHREPGCVCWGRGRLRGALCEPLLSALVTLNINNREDALRPHSGPAQASSRTLPRVLVQS